MQQFVIPQFIDVEDKIFGPITTRQFIILLLAGGIIFLSYKLADFMLFILILAVVGGSALVLAFIKINGQPFHFFILNIIQTVRRPSRRIWHKKYTKQQLKEFIKKPEVEIIEKIKDRPRASYSRLRDLSLTVNTGGHYRGDNL